MMKKSYTTLEILTETEKKEWTIFQRLLTGNLSQITELNRSVLIENLVRSEKFSLKALTLSSQTALHLFCLRSVKENNFMLNENYRVSKLLLQKGVDFNQKDNRGETALMLACQNGYKSVVCALLEWVHSKNIVLVLDVEDSFGETAMMKAARNRNSDAHNLLTSELFLQAVLKKNGALVNRILNSTRDQFSRCFRIHFLQTIKVKLNFEIGLATTSDMPHHNNPMLINLLEDKLPSCNRFFDYFLSCFLKDKLHSQPIVDLLLTFCKTICEATEDDSTVHSLAVSQCDEQSKEIQLEEFDNLMESRKFDVGLSGDELEKLLLFACRISTSDEQVGRRIEEIIKNLLSRGIGVNQRNLSGQTVLMIACENNNVVAVRQLLNWRNASWNKVDISAKDDDGHTALSIAKLSSNAEIVTLIKEVLFLNAIENGDLETAKNYLNCRPTDEEQEQQLEVSKNSGLTYEPPPPKRFYAAAELSSDKIFSYSLWLEAVWRASTRPHKDIYYMLINDCRYTKRLNETGQSVLHVAIEEYFETKHYRRTGESKMFKKVDILLRSGNCDINCLNLQEETALHMICYKWSLFPFNYNSDKNILKIILEQKVDVNRRNIHGKTALMVACENGRTDFVELLLKYSKKKKHNFHLDFDGVDHSSETLLSKSMQNKDIDACALLCRSKLLAAIENIDIGVVKSMLDDRVNEDDITNVFRISADSTKMERNGTCNRKFVINFELWKDAVIKANSKSEVILNHLLDYDAIVQSQEGEKGISLLHRFFQEDEDFTDKELCLIKILLKSRKVDINTTNFKAQTILHSASYVEDDDKIICEAVSLLLLHGINANAKESEGKTALIIAGEQRRPSIIGTILNWAKETDTHLDLNAKDLDGRTALMKATEWKCVDTVEKLLEAGASVNLTDNRGFTALHHALLEIPSNSELVISSDISDNYGEFQKRKALIQALLDADESYDFYDRDREELNMDKIKAVDLLLRRPELNVNALDYEGYSPLDIAVGYVPEIPSSIVNALRQKEANLNAFQPKHQQLMHNPDLMLHRFADIKRSLMLDSNDVVIKSKECFSKLSRATQEQLVSARNQKSRTPLHHAVIACQYYSDSDLRNNIPISLESLIVFGCNVNAIDIYGRTPLHYACTGNVETLLLKYGADRSIKDNYGMSADEMTKTLQEVKSRKSNRSYIFNISKMTVDDIILNGKDNKTHFQSFRSDGTVQCLELLKPLTILDIAWDVGEYAYRHPLVNEITNEVRNFMESLSSEIGKLDQRFQTKSAFVGSSFEGTKIDYPDEFDFNFVLSKFCQLCEVSLSPELPTGFVHLKRKHGTKQSECDTFFDENEILITEKVNAHFKILLNRVLADDCFIKNHLNFDWRRCLREDNESPFYINTGLVTTLELNIMKLNFDRKRYFQWISVDIVPCIHIDDWWPDQAITDLSEELKTIGCNLVFDYPQRWYPWVPFSESCVRISFAPAESEMIRRSSDEARTAYMIGKHMIKNTNDENLEWNTSYVLKNSLLYCIEAFQSPSALTSSNPKDFRLWLKCLMKCHFLIASHDFCPCYFMPTFNLPIDKYKASFYTKCLTPDDDEFTSTHLPLYKLYLIASLEGSPQHLPVKELDFSFKMPSLNPVLEHFDRTALITELSKCKLNSFEELYVR